MFNRNELRKVVAQYFENYAYSNQNNLHDTEKWRSHVLNAMSRLNEYDKKKEGRTTPLTRYRKSGFNQDIC